MIWMITERQVVYSLVKMRRRRSKNRRKIGNTYHGSNFDDYIRRTYGIEKTIFEGTLFMDEFSYRWFSKWFKVLYEKLRPVYLELFHDDLKESIKNCIKKGYVEPKHYGGKEYLKDTEMGRKLLSPFYFPRKVIEYEPLRDLLGKALKWIVILTFGYAGISAIVGS
jgi:hypothetical protein